ncbi:hypothetical protein HY605_00025 [Candidatus Peregrinibacteria bacterium]|nr:hypothetical protein [Candidatus Peregrinibacteria bacterium]
MKSTEPSGDSGLERKYREQDLLLNLVDRGVLDLNLLSNRLKLQVPTHGIQDFSELGMARAIADWPIKSGALSLRTLREAGVVFDETTLRLMGFQDEELTSLVLSGLVGLDAKVPAPGADDAPQVIVDLERARDVVRRLQAATLGSMAVRGFEIPSRPGSPADLEEGEERISA